MTKHIVVILGHPGTGGTYCRALAESYAAGARVGGHALRRIDIATMELPWLRDRYQFHDSPAPAQIRAAQADLLWADHLAIFLPLWLGGAPAMFKAFLEQTLRPGFARRHGEWGAGTPMLSGRSARIFLTLGMSAWAYRWRYGALGLRMIERHCLRECGIGPVRRSLIGHSDIARIDSRIAWLRKVEELGRAGD